MDDDAFQIERWRDRNNVCPTCDGMGAALNVFGVRDDCPNCNGTGKSTTTDKGENE
jgi:DnaJ-class molecular chaperone